MKTRKLLGYLALVSSLSLAAPPAPTLGVDPSTGRVLENGQRPDDVRLRAPKDLNGYFPFEVPESKEAWLRRQLELKQRVLVATGLFPLPERTPLNAVIHSKVERDGFTVEKVYFESLPGHYVTGLLFRPAGEPTSKRPAVLCPHGHGGRQQDHGEANMEELIQSGAELYAESGRFPKLARCAQLARMGCVAFIFDMLGYTDSQQVSYQLAHRYAERRPEFETDSGWGFYSPQAEGRLHSILGLQTWNGIRGLDFLESLPDVDPQRLGVTGGSGGGTQTILLGAIDDRPIAAFPNGMVSTSMQGGCTCENCSLLRIGTGNVELAALFAPRPQAMTAADDWTKEMMTKGYPELRQLYAMLGAADNVYCEEMLHFPHNYNAVTRSIMYHWMNQHLGLGLEVPIKEQDWKLLTEEESTVWNSEHPAPAGGDDYERRLLQQLDQRDRAVLFNHAPRSGAEAATYFTTVRAAWQTLVGRDLPAPDSIQRTKVWKESRDHYWMFGDLLTLTVHGEQLPTLSIYPKDVAWNRKVVLWIDGQGKAGMLNNGSPREAVLRLVEAGYAVVGVDLYGQGEFSPDGVAFAENPTVKSPRQFAGYTYCYNDTVFARRVHDILTMIAWVSDDEHEPTSVHALGVEGAGPLLAAARAIAGDRLTAVAIDTGGFRFAKLGDWKDANFLPGAIKYGDLPTLLAVSAPSKLWLTSEPVIPPIIRLAYQASGQSEAIFLGEPTGDTAAAAVGWLLHQ